MIPTVLIADDEPSLRLILSKVMEKKGLTVLETSNGLEALHCLQTKKIDLAFLDIRMPEKTGLDVLQHRNDFPSQPLIFVMTAQDTMENAVAAMKNGAYDYLTKPFHLEEVGLLVDRALETRRLEEENKTLREENKDLLAQQKPTLIGRSHALKQIFKTIGKIADQDITVLIQGESGTGKELVARAIHFQGNRASHPFVTINCSAIPENLLESELFGVKKGAFSGADTDRVGYFEKSHRGTLFLDEIGEMPLALQAKLLRVLQEKEIQRLGESRTTAVDVRVIAATNKNLQNSVREGLFREDLFFRLNVVPLQIPSLKDHAEDIPLLAQYFLEKCARDFQMPPKSLPEASLQFLCNQSWPGNIRELENTLKRAFILSQGRVLEIHDFDIREKHFVINHSQSFEDNLKNLIFPELEKLDSKTPVLDFLLPQFEKVVFQWALEKMGGNQLQAAQILGMNRNTLHRRLQEMGIK